jgi:hypothetical protein
MTLASLQAWTNAAVFSNSFGGVSPAALNALLNGILEEILIGDSSGLVTAAQFPALTGPVTTTAGSLMTSVSAGAITSAMLASGAAAANLGFTPLNPANNLSDVVAASTARTNLGAGAANGLATLDSTGKLPSSQLPTSVTGALNFKGTWNASTNSPTLASGTGTKGDLYVVATAGTTTLDGVSSWSVGDWAIYNGTAWTHVAAVTAGVLSVAGLSGAVSASALSAAITAAAGTLTGSTLASGVTASSLTSLGTLGALTVSGTATSGAFVAANGGGVKFADTGGLTTFGAKGAEISTASDNNLYFDNYEAGHTFRVSASFTESLKISATGAVTVLNTLGVGAPATVPLDILSAQTYGPHLRITSSGAEAGLQLNSTSTGGRQYDIVSGGSGGSYFGGSFGIFDATASVTRLAITAAGNLGIGTTTPSYAVDIATSQSLGPHLRIVSSGQEAAVQLSATSTGGRNWEIISGGSGGSFSGGSFGVYDASASAVRLAISPAGNVGIGNPSPSYPIDVATSQSLGPHLRIVSSGQEAAVQLSATSSGGRMWDLVSGGAGGALIGGSFGIYDATASAVRLAITSAGNVGIGGSLAPSEKLEVNGAIHLDSATPNSSTNALYNNAGVLTWNGAALSSFVASGTGGVTRALQAKLNDMVWLDDYKSIFDSDDTAAWQRAANQCGALLASGQGVAVVMLRSRAHYVSGTITHPPNTGYMHLGPKNACSVIRTGDYGSTIVCGVNGGAAAGAFIGVGVFFVHGTMYVSGSNALSTPLATSGGHIELFGAQDCILRDNIFWRHRVAIIFHGGSILHVEDNTFVLVWDPTYSAAQEGLASIWLDAASSFGNPKDFYPSGNQYMGGDNSANPRSRTITDANGNSQTLSMIPMMGPINHWLVDGCETIDGSHEYLGNASQANIFLRPKGANGYIGNVRLDGFIYDGAGNAQVFVQMDPTSTKPVKTLELSAMQCNGELTTYQGIVILSQGGLSSVEDLTLDNVSVSATFGSSLILDGVDTFTITGGSKFTNYNCWFVTPNSAPIDLNFGAAIWVKGPDTENLYGLIDDISIGGWGNNLALVGGQYLGVFVDGAQDKVHIGRVAYLGVNGMTGVSQDQPVTLAGGATYTANAWTRTYFCNTGGGAITVNLPANAPPGCEIVFTDIYNASAANITISPNAGYIGGSTGNLVMNTQHASIKLKSNGGNNWWLSL